MDRRAFAAGLSGMVSFRLARAQTARHLPRIGLVTAGFATFTVKEPNASKDTYSAFLRGMHDLGYVLGKDFLTETRAGDGKPEQYFVLAEQLVRSRCDVIVAAGPTLPAVMQATTTIPIVMVGGALDPVRDGFAKSLGQPGGNITGLSIQQVDTTAKRLEILKEITGEATVGAIWEATSRSSWIAADAAAKARGWKLVSLEVKDASGIERAFKAANDSRVGAVLVISGGRMYGQQQQVVELAAASRLPAIYSLRAFTEVGGLMSYGADLIDSWRRSAMFVDRILKGARPADMPIEQPTKFEFVVNLKTAKALSISMPSSLLLRADEIIE